MIDLPRPTKGAHQKGEATVSVVSAVIDTLLPIAGTAVGSLFKDLIRKRLEAAQAVLVEELRSGHIEIIDNKDLDEFIPIAYRFVEAARRGERLNIIRSYAKLIRVDIADSRLKSDEFLGIASAMEGLDEKALMVLAKYCKLKNARSDDKIVEIDREIRDNSKEDIGISSSEALQFNGVLQGRGFLLSFTPNAMGGSDQVFYPSKMALELFEKLER